MDFIKKLIMGLVFSLPILSYAAPTPGNFGLVLVHGTSDHRLDADGVYWKTDFTQALAKNLANPENMLIAHCDFSQYMWHADAAGCLAQQIHDFVTEKKIDRLLIITHSDGGNVMRWIMSNPGYDPLYPEIIDRIQDVIAIAPSSAGSALADQLMDGGAFEAAVAWLLGYNSDSVQQQREMDMAIYNDQVLIGTEQRPSLTKPFRVIVGTDVAASPFSSSSYCNGFFLNAGLKVTRIYLDFCADGFLNCSSQTSAGELWFKDVDKTQDQLTLSHNQSRHSCFGLDQVLAAEIKAQGELR